jgi:hypothetical protein
MCMLTLQLESTQQYASDIIVNHQLYVANNLYKDSIYPKIKSSNLLILLSHSQHSALPYLNTERYVSEHFLYLKF